MSTQNARIRVPSAADWKLAREAGTDCYWGRQEPGCLNDDGTVPGVRICSMCATTARVLSALAQARAEEREACEKGRDRFERVGRLYCELWELGAPWPIPQWTCDKHGVVGCLPCRSL